MQANAIDVATLKQWLDNGEAILIDVREPSEYKASNIPSSILKPSSLLHSDDPAISKKAAFGKKIVLHCQRGSRGTNTCKKLLRQCSELELYNLEGGIEACAQAGLPVNKQEGNALPLDRQVQLAIGCCLLLFSLLTYFINSAFALVIALFGLGLANAGLTGWCGLAKLMSKMPWNQTG